MGGPIWAVSQIVTVFFGRVKDEVADGTVGGATGFKIWFSFLKVENPGSEMGHGFQSGGLFKEVLLGLLGSLFIHGWCC